MRGVMRREQGEDKIMELGGREKTNFKVVRWVEIYLFFLLHGDGIWRALVLIHLSIFRELKNRKIRIVSSFVR